MVPAVIAAINSGATLSYSYADKQATSLPAEKLYYRLQMIDIGPSIKPSKLTATPDITFRIAGSF